MRSTSLACIAGLSFVTAALVVVAGCARGPARVTPRASVKAPVASRFVGNQACRECHRGEFDAHHGSSHDTTLRLADTGSLGTLAPPAGRIESTKHEIVRERDRLIYRRTDQPGRQERLDYAFGSGKIGMTYVAMKREGAALELRMSRMPNDKSWYLTPGQEARADDDIGASHDAATMRRCFGCHSAPDASAGVRPDPRLFGVGCESCHGAGSAHIDAIRTRDRDIRMENLGALPARALNERCGVCHRTADSINLNSSEATMTQRFQPYGIMQSPCFLKSNESVSCLTCHDPHTNASTSEAHYVEVCLKCHGSSAPSAASGGNLPVKCPVNPRDKCVGCHMPSRKLLPFSRIPVYMADHLIWAYGKKGRAGEQTTR